MVFPSLLPGGSPQPQVRARCQRSFKTLQEHKWIHLVGDTKSYIELCRDIAKLTSSGGRPYCGEGGFIIIWFQPLAPFACLVCSIAVRIC